MGAVRLLLILFFIAAPLCAADAPPEVWLRRVWLDLAGAPPPVAEVDAFLARPDAATRKAVVAKLLASPECAARWARLLAAGLAPADDEQGGKALEPFLRSELAAGKAWWRTLGALVTPGGKGSPSALFQRPFHDDGSLIAGQIGTGMLGIQLRCARCHDDPTYGWTAAEHFGLAAFYGRPRSMHAPSRLVAAHKAGKIRNFYELVMNLPTMRPRGPDHRWVRREIEAAADTLNRLHALGIGPPAPSVRGLDWAAFDVYRIHAQRAAAGRAGGLGGTTAVPIPGTVEELRMPALVPLKVPHPTRLSKGQTVPPRFPGDQANAKVSGKRRDALTAWISDPDNPFTGRALTNRAWSVLYGRGMVEPAGEVGHTTEAANAKQLAEWSKAFVESGGKLAWLLEKMIETSEYAKAGATPASLSDASLPAEAPATAPVWVAAASITTQTTATAHAPEATVPVGTWRFREAEQVCLRDRGARDPLARLAEKGLRVLDRDQLAAALAAATGATQPLASNSLVLEAEAQRGDRFKDRE